MARMVCNYKQCKIYLLGPGPKNQPGHLLEPIYSYTTYYRASLLRRRCFFRSSFCLFSPLLLLPWYYTSSSDDRDTRNSAKWVWTATFVVKLFWYKNLYKALQKNDICRANHGPSYSKKLVARKKWRYFTKLCCWQPLPRRRLKLCTRQHPMVRSFRTVFTKYRAVRI